MEVGIPYEELINYAGTAKPPREFYMKPVHFRLKVTLFRPYLGNYGPDLGKLLDKAKRYSVLNMTTEEGDAPRFKTMSIGIISDVGGANCGDVMDRLAIISNCCNYSRRLDCRRLGDFYNLSTCLLALFLLNGELLHFPTRKSSVNPLLADWKSLTVHELLQRYSLRFDPPVLRYQLSFIKKCRLPNVRFTADGIETSGWMWRLEEALSAKLPKYFDPCFRHEPSTLRDFHKPFLNMISKELKKHGHRGLSKKIDNFLSREEQDPEPDRSASDWYQLKMVDALLNALKQGKVLRLGRLCNHDEPSAIFVSPAAGVTDDASNSQIFTTWCQQRSEYTYPNFVSVLVQHDGAAHSVRKHVRTVEWINGLWFAKKDDSFGKVVFSWPF
jgi:hypothetical protein